ncbi:MAG: hypothetical protein ACKO2K_05370 [Alphaproteobacteria bacterium]
MSVNSGTARPSIGFRLGLPPSSVKPRRKSFMSPGPPMLSAAPTLKKWQRSSPTYMRPLPPGRRSTQTERDLNRLSR